MAAAFSLAFQNMQPIKTIATVTHTAFLEVMIPQTTKKISVGCSATALYVSFSYADGDGAATTDCAFVPSGNFLTMNIPTGLESFCVLSQSGSASIVVVILAELL